MAGDATACDKYQSLVADRGLLTSLMEAAASGKLDAMNLAVQKIKERYAGHSKEGEAEGNADFLLEFRDGNGRTLAHFAALGGCQKNLELAIRLCPAAVKSRDNAGKTPLFFSAMLGDIPAIELLLNNEAEVNAEAEGGSTPLHEAVYAGKVAAVKRLLKGGADVSRMP